MDILIYLLRGGELSLDISLVGTVKIIRLVFPNIIIVICHSGLSNTYITYYASTNGICGSVKIGLQ